MAKGCSVTGCENKYKAIGLCGSHWKIYKRYGSATPTCWCGELSQTFSGNYAGNALCETHTFLQRFWDNVAVTDEDSCWEWQGSKTTANYGVVYYQGKLQYTHRLSLELDGRPVPPRHHACHTCDNPSCVNPKHLFVGTPMDNAQDKVAKNRHTYGEIHPNAKLTNEDVIKLRKLAAEGVWQSDLARMFGVDESHVSNIVNNLVRRTA